MTELTEENLQELRRAFDLTQDSGVVDQYGAKKMLQIFNMNPTTEDVTKKLMDHNKDSATVGLTFDEFKSIFHDYLLEQDKVPDALDNTLGDLFNGQTTKEELRKILTEMGSEPFEPEEADEVINEITFDEAGNITQEDLKAFLLNRVEMTMSNDKQETEADKLDRASPEVKPSGQESMDDEE